MATTTCTDNVCCYAPRGEIFLREYDPCCWEDYGGENPNAWVSIANSKDFSVDVTRTKITQEDYTACVPGRDYCSQERIDEITASLTMLCFNPDNFQKLTAGTLNSVDAGNGVMTAAFRSCVGPVQYINDADNRQVMNIDPDSVTIEVDDGNGGSVTLVSGNDFTADTDAITFDCESPTIQALIAAQPAPVAPAIFSAGLPMIVNFGHEAYSSIDMYESPGCDYELWLRGCNTIDGRRFSERMFRVRMAPASNIALIAEEFAEFPTTLEILTDPCSGQYATFAI